MDIASEKNIRKEKKGIYSSFPDSPIFNQEAVCFFLFNLFFHFFYFFERFHKPWATDDLKYL